MPFSCAGTKGFGNPDIDAGGGVQPGQNAIIDLIQSNRMIVACADDAGNLTDSFFSFIAIGLR